MTASGEKERIRQQKYKASKAGKISKSPAFKSKTTNQGSQTIIRSTAKFTSETINGCPKVLFQTNMAEYVEPLSGTGRRGISAELEKCVKDFDERYVNSREAPGKLDTIKLLMDQK